MIIYKTTNIVNGKFYIGQDSKNNPDYLGSGLLLKKAIEKYGRDNFVKEVLEECETKEQLNEREIHWIAVTEAKTLGYNIADGGHGGNTYTEETRQRISKLFTGRTVSNEVIEKLKGPRKNKPRISEEERKRRSDLLKEQRNNPEFIQKQRDGYDTCEFEYSSEFLNNQGKPHFTGHNHSEETKRKMSESHKNNPVSYWAGKKMPKEMVDKANESRRNRTPEQKLETYVKTYTSKFGIEPSEELKQQKLLKYRGL